MGVVLVDMQTPIVHSPPSTSGEATPKIGIEDLSEWRAMGVVLVDMQTPIVHANV